MKKAMTVAGVPVYKSEYIPKGQTWMIPADAISVVETRDPHGLLLSRALRVAPGRIGVIVHNTDQPAWE